MRWIAIAVIATVSLPLSAAHARRSHFELLRHPRPRPPADVPTLLTLARGYLDEERALDARGDATPVKAREVIDQWDRLHLVRLGFERLERRRELAHAGEARRVRLRHTLAQLLGRAVDVDAERAGDELRTAQARHAEDLAALRDLAARAFDFEQAPPSS
jgi:hypothetical protein